jgi:hypothetical protein
MKFAIESTAQWLKKENDLNFVFLGEFFEEVRVTQSDCVPRERENVYNRGVFSLA